MSIVSPMYLAKMKLKVDSLHEIWLVGFQLTHNKLLPTVGNMIDDS